MQEIQVRGVGLVAFVKMHLPLERFCKDTGAFIFKSDIPAEDWAFRYEQSECRRHDLEVMSVRDFLKTVRNSTK